MNPKGQWIKINDYYWQFCKPEYAIYGVVKLKSDVPEGHMLWFWQARTDLNSRPLYEEVPCGYVRSEDGAKKIVELILKETETCEF